MARIQHATEIVPAGLYEPGEEEGTIKLAEEIPTFNTDKMKGAENWVHLPKALLKLGRTSYPPVPADLDEEAQAAWTENL